ncbi:MULTISPECIES: PID-CTERM protein-sorting domain-containing protein [unclassified Polaribacter]|uniref:PID-CTERM protein-sorting domain-containing protein n=1 Tax=unclassified Polaribacter TaxID=196858 RepID=UPI000909F6D5|nr:MULTISPECIES: hypothetical protein [unclassified Polaribacter]AQS94777.1 hypothetical protein BXQ17_12115 [Polaribacter sp. BM10]SHM96313.1 hypothetical protein SAMN05720268_1691 [Polaribacter sp. KT 15]
MKKIKYLVLIIVLLSTQLVCGQMVPPPIPPPPPPGLSVDGGVIFLLASALIYGVAKLRN